jgi:hypothetical protein
MNEHSYVREINSIDRELKRINAHAKSLRAQKTSAMVGLHHYMVNHNLEKVGTGKNTITLKKCESHLPNRPKRNAKPKAQKKADAIMLFREVGIPDPDTFYHEFEMTQKLQENALLSDNLRKDGKKSRKNEKDVDPFLGY